MDRNTVKKVLYEDEGVFIASIDQKEFLMVDINNPNKHLYAWAPEVFLKFMPYAKVFKGDQAVVASFINALIATGRVKHSKADVYEK